MNDLSSNTGKPGRARPEAALAAQLTACQHCVTDRGRDLFAAFQRALEDKLLDFMDKAKTNKEAQQLQEIVRLLGQHRKPLLETFVSNLNDGFAKFKTQRLNTPSIEEKQRGRRLSLVDNEDLEENIAVSTVARRAEERHGEILWFLNQRLAVLNHGEKVHESNNPLGPRQFCESLRKVLATIPVSTKGKLIAYKIFDGELAGNLGGILEEVNRYLIEQDILPNLDYKAGTATPAEPAPEKRSASEPKADASPGAGGTVEGAAEGPAASAPGGPEVTDVPEGHQQNLLQSIRTLQQQIAAGGIAPNGIAPGGAVVSPDTGAGADTGAGTVYSNQQLISALHLLQTQALTAGPGFDNTASDYDLAAASQKITLVGQQLVQHLQQEAGDGEVDPEDMHIIDLVGMLFEYMLSDEQLPDSVKTMLSYLHTPFLKIAFIDPTFFESAEHPARLLLDNLAEAGTLWVSNDGTSYYEIQDKIKDTVTRVLEEFENDVHLFAELLMEFSAYMKKIVRRHELVEKRAMEKAQGEEKLREVKLRVNSEIRARTDGRELPSVVLLLLLQPWSDFLAFILLRYGDQSDSWKNALGVVDGILWSIEAKRAKDDKIRQMEMFDELLDSIENGFETIGYDRGKGKKLIESLVSLQKMAMQSQQPEPAPAPVRDKLENEAAEKAGGAGGALPAATADEADLVESLKTIEFGTWLEFEGGKRLKVAWYNSKTMHYMLVDQTGKKVATTSGLALARDILSAKVRVIAGSAKPFFERALENILEHLNAKADAIQPENGDG